MKHCHTEGFIHHDLKLENILLNIDNNGNISDVKLADFGLSKRSDEHLIAGPHTAGTPPYMAPEMLIKKTKFGNKIDSWSLGIILYELLFGQTLFDSNDYKTIVRQITQFQSLDFTETLFKNTSKDVQDLLNQLLCKK